MSEDNKNENAVGQVTVHYERKGLSGVFPDEHFYGGAVVCRSGDIVLADQQFGSIDEVLPALNKLAKECKGGSVDPHLEDVASFKAKMGADQVMELTTYCGFNEDKAEFPIPDTYLSDEAKDVAYSLAHMSIAHSSGTCMGHKLSLPVAEIASDRGEGRG